MKKLPKHEYSQGVAGDGAAILKDGQPMNIEEILGELRDGQKTAQAALDYGFITHDLIVANQSAWIEWQHGEGAEAGMQWVQNGLWGPGHIPDENEPWATNAQHYYNANKHDAFPVCSCGNPSSILSGGNYACSRDHLPKKEA